MRLVINPVLIMVALVMMLSVTPVFCEERTEEQEPPQYTANNRRWAHTENTPEELKGDSSKCMAGGKKYLSSHGGAYEEVKNY